MSALFTRASSQRMTAAAVQPDPTGNWTLFAWVKPNTPSATSDLMTVLSAGRAADAGGPRLIAQGASVVTSVGAVYREESTTGTINTGGATIYELGGRWTPVIVRWHGTSNPLRRFGVGYGQVGGFTQRWTTGAADLVAVGATYRSGVFQDFFDGRIAHVAAWNTDLSNDDADLLARREYPSNVSAANLVAYLPLTSDFTDAKGVTWTNTNAVTIDADNPTMGLTTSSGGGVYVG